MKFSYLRSKTYWIYVFIVAVFLSLLNPLWVSSFSANARLLSYCSLVNYEMTITLDNKKQDSYYLVTEDYFQTVDEDGSYSGYIKANSLMLDDIAYEGMGYYKKENVLKGEYRVLSADECSVTENVSKAYGLKLGSQVYSVFEEKVFSYKVISILKDTYNFLSPEADKFEPYIFSGCREEKKGDNPRYLSFALIKDEIDKNASDPCFISEVVKFSKGLFIKDVILGVLFFFLATLVYFVLNRKDVLNMVRLGNLGYNKGVLSAYLLLEGGSTFLIVFALGLIPALATSYLAYFSIEAGAICLALVLINIVKLLWKLRREHGNPKTI